MTEWQATQKGTRQRVRAIACEIAYRELCFLAALAHNIVDLAFLPKGLHDIETPDMVSTIQEAIDATDPNVYDAVVLAYGLCNNGTVGLRARTVPVVVPRAHDCITFFLGSRQRYRAHFDRHPGTYYRTTGWSERSFAGVDGRVEDRLGLNRTYEELVGKYGEENARFIYEMTTAWERNYERIAYIEVGVGAHLGHDRSAEEEARRRGWTFARLPGDLGLLARLLDGPWHPEDFLLLPSGHRIVATNDESIFAAAADRDVSGDDQEPRTPLVAQQRPGDGKEAPQR